MHAKFTMLGLALVLFAVVSWIYNVYKFFGCDFESPYKCEAVHATGIFIPPTAMVTAYIDPQEADNGE